MKFFLGVGFILLSPIYALGVMYARRKFRERKGEVGMANGNTYPQIVDSSIVYKSVYYGATS